jgi:uroporphyrinogen decarboxylase
LGIRWRRGAFGSKFAVDEAIAGPFTDASTVADVLAFPWPTAADFDFAPLQDEADANADRVRVGGLWTGILGDSYRMLGFQNFLCTLAADPDLAHALVDRMTEMYLALHAAYFEALKGRLDVWFFGNDFGSQDPLLFSTAMWDDFFFENVRRLTALAHGYGLKVMMHSCGAIAPLIPLLIEAGVDILKPVQPQSMDFADLHAKYGDRLSFSGTIGTQRLMPYGTPEEIRAEVRRNLAVAGPKGGLFCCPTHMLEPEVPGENVEAYVEAARVFHP